MHERQDYFHVFPVPATLVAGGLFFKSFEVSQPFSLVVSLSGATWMWPEVFDFGICRNFTLAEVAGNTIRNLPKGDSFMRQTMEGHSKWSNGMCGMLSPAILENGNHARGHAAGVTIPFHIKQASQGPKWRVLRGGGDPDSFSVLCSPLSKHQ